MKDVAFGDVLKKLPLSLYYFAVGLAVGEVAGLLLYNINRAAYEYLLNLWSQRIFWGAPIFGVRNWFILNNLIAMFLIVAATVIMMVLIFKRRKYQNRRFALFEKHHPKITLLSLYMVPIGALIVNGFSLSFFLTYGLLKLGFQVFTTSVLLTLPHGINEILGLLFATSLGLNYLDVLSPYIVRKQRAQAMRIGKKLLYSQTTFFVFVFIVILIIFSGFIEGNLTLQLLE